MEQWFERYIREAGTEWDKRTVSKRANDPASLSCNSHIHSVQRDTMCAYVYTLIYMYISVISRHTRAEPNSQQRYIRESREERCGWQEWKAHARASGSAARATGPSAAHAIHENTLLWPMLLELSDWPTHPYLLARCTEKLQRLCSLLLRA